MTATPIFQQNQKTLRLDIIEATSNFFPSNDASGSPVNISSGYTARIRTQNAANQMPGGNPVTDVSSSFSLTLGTTGLTLATVYEGLDNAFSSSQLNYSIDISTDTFSTFQTIAYGTLQLYTAAIQP
jgi:hypothetical protein